MFTLEIATRISAVFVAIGLLLSSAQLLSGLREFRASGLFDWSSRRNRATRGWMTGRTGTALLQVALIARIAGCAALLVPFQSDLLYGSYAILILVTGLFLAYQIGYGKDGSNQISVIVMAGLAFTFLMPASSPFRPVGLYFIAAQAVLSYFAAGLSKLVSARWRDGSALRTILNTASYGDRTIGALVVRRPWIAGIAGWSVIVIEIVFPVALVAPLGVLIALLIAGALLHLGTVALIGLDTFFWAFTATFPAIIFAHGVLVGF